VPRALLLHGFTGSAASWAEVAHRLEGDGVETHAVELPGHGRRAGEHDPACFTLPSVLREIDDALGDASRWSGRGGGPPWLIGYSMGGRLALHYAVEHSDRIAGLVIESASPGLETPSERAARREADEALARALESDGIESFVERWERLPLFESQRWLPEERRRRIREGRLANDPLSLASSLRGLGTGRLPSLWGRLSTMAGHTLIVVGALDRKFVEIGRRMEPELGAGSLAVVADAGHHVHLEAPEAWCRRIVRHIADHETEGR
jgi:2-succinyl-6-hydroxy-2,4-cyclohexadiene-1-carboxylate synthase